MADGETTTARKADTARVRDRNGDERIEMLLPLVTIKEEIWNKALDKGIKSLVAELHRRADHGRSEDELSESVLACLDRQLVAASVAKEYVKLISREVKDHLETHLDIELSRVEATPSGFMELLVVTLSIPGAAKVFNCMVSIDRSGHLERLREYTASMRNWEWGMLLDRFVGCVDVVGRKQSSVYARLFRELCADKDAFRRALVEGLDHHRLKVAVYGAFTLDMDPRTSTMH